MTKSDIQYANVNASEPYVEGFAVGSSHAVTVIVDENSDVQNNNIYTASPQDVSLDGSRKPIVLPVCPKCSQAHARTRTRTYPSFVTWVGVTVGAAIFFPLCWIPLVVDNMKQTDHFCQTCGSKIGTIKALEGCFVKEQM